MKSGDVEKIEAQTVFSQHHINAFETSGKNGPEIVLDLSPSFTFGLRYQPLPFFIYQSNRT